MTRTMHMTRAFYGAILLLLIGALGDAVSTAIAVSSGIPEDDPINRARIEQWGLPGALAFYLAIGAAFILLCLLLWRGSFALARRWSWFAPELRVLRVFFLVMVAAIAAQRIGITLWNVYALHLWANYAAT